MRSAACQYPRANATNSQNLMLKCISLEQRTSSGAPTPGLARGSLLPVKTARAAITKSNIRLARGPPPLPPPTTFSLAKHDPTKKVDQPVQYGGSPSGLEEADQRVLPATPPERAEADITRLDRLQRGVQPPGRCLRGHDTDARGRRHLCQPGDVHHDRGYRDTYRGIQPNPCTRTPPSCHFHRTVSPPMRPR